MNEYFAAFACGFVVSFACIGFPVVLALALRTLRLRKAARLAIPQPPAVATLTQLGSAGRTTAGANFKDGRVYPDELDPVVWTQLRNVMVALGFSMTVTYQDGRKVARFILKEPKS